MIVDTHTHLYLPEFGPHPEEAVDRATQNGVGMMILPNVDINTIEPMYRLHELRPGSTAMAMGLHPTEVDDNSEKNLNEIVRKLKTETDNFVAVGEIGIDLYWDTTFKDRQMDVFRKQCLIAAELDLPVIIHCRDGLEETLEVLDSLEKIPEGVFHSFSGMPDDVKRIRKTGDFYFGINGIATFKNSRLTETINEIGAERILLETDAPYLAPVPHRGKRNESAYIIHTAAYVASALNIELTKLEQITTKSAERLFKLI